MYRSSAIIVMVLIGTFARAQQPEPRANLEAGYVYRYQAVGSMHGAAVAVAVPIWHNFETVAEGTWAGGSLRATEPFPRGGTPTEVLFDVDSRFVTAMAGVRLSGTTPRYPGFRLSVQLLGGLVRTQLSEPVALFGVNSFGAQGGIGVEIPLSRRLSIRPQADAILGRLSMLTPNGRRGGLYLVVGRRP